jgi:hypothetical protein
MYIEESLFKQFILELEKYRDMYAKKYDPNEPYTDPANWNNIIDKIRDTYPGGNEVNLDIPETFYLDEGHMLYMEWHFQDGDIYVGLLIKFTDMSCILDFEDWKMGESGREIFDILDNGVWNRIILLSGENLYSSCS